MSTTRTEASIEREIPVTIWVKVTIEATVEHEPSTYMEPSSTDVSSYVISRITDDKGVLEAVAAELKEMELSGDYDEALEEDANQ